MVIFHSYVKLPEGARRKFNHVGTKLRNLPIVWEPREPAKRFHGAKSCWQMERPKMISEDSLGMQSFQNHMKTSYIYI